MMAAMLHVEGDRIEALLGDDLDGQGIWHAGPCGEQRFIGCKAGLQGHLRFLVKDRSFSRKPLQGKEKPPG